jgi:hypothetical protein
MGQVAPDAPEPDAPQAEKYTPNPAEAALIAALRSGEFKQGTRRLRPGDSFCCLGVACELYRRETGHGEWVDDDDIYVGPIHTFKLEERPFGESSVLPVQVMRWLGWVDQAGYLSADDCLTHRNDSGSTFSEIADLIEQGKVERA